MGRRALAVTLIAVDLYAKVITLSVTLTISDKRRLANILGRKLSYCAHIPLRQGLALIMRTPTEDCSDFG
jgi:hypothetical protein